ncbi:MAG: hypothetical protein AAFV53_33265, partial [Myxococcota bacterium]
MIRFSSLGDIVLTGAVTARLGAVTYLTSPRFKPLAAKLPGVADVIAYGQAPLPARAAKNHDQHASPRTRSRN